MLVNAWIVPLIYLDFEVREDYIRKVLCINQDRPITECGGKCYLNNRLKDVTERQENESATPIEGGFFSLFSEKVTYTYLKPFYFHQASATFLLHDENIVDNYNQGIFRPPRLS